MAGGGHTVKVALVVARARGEERDDANLALGSESRAQAHAGEARGVRVSREDQQADESEHDDDDAGRGAEVDAGSARARRRAPTGGTAQDEGKRRRRNVVESLAQ